MEQAGTEPGRCWGAAGRALSLSRWDSDPRTPALIHGICLAQTLKPQVSHPHVQAPRISPVHSLLRPEASAPTACVCWGGDPRSSLCAWGGSAFAGRC